MSLYKTNHDIVYSTKSIVQRVIKKGQELVFLDKNGDEISLSNISKHTQHVLAQSANEFPWLEDSEENGGSAGPVSATFNHSSGVLLLGSEENFVFVVDIEGIVKGMIIHVHVENPLGGWNIFDNYDFVANENDPYDGQGQYYSNLGITVEYEETEEGGRFEMDFGSSLTAGAIASGEITIIVALYDENDYVWGNVNQPDEENAIVLDVQELG